MTISNKFKKAAKYFNIEYPITDNKFKVIENSYTKFICCYNNNKYFILT